MAGMHVVWAKPATDDILHIKEYLSDRSKENAAWVTRTIMDAIKSLGDQPYLGRQGHVAGTRELVIPKLPYIVVYAVIESKSPSEIAIYHIYHGSRNWQVLMETEFIGSPKQSI